MSESNEGWRECADPVELAAAAAAGVEVQYELGGVWYRNYFVTADEFAGCGLRYSVPASWSWSPEPPAPVTGDDLPERRVWSDCLDATPDDWWVEVRAPRAVPVPETERVPWWEAVGRELVDGLMGVENAMICEVGREGDRVYVCGYEDPDNPDEDDRGDWQRNYWYGRDGFDGTVEVLRRDGEQ